MHGTVSVRRKKKEKVHLTEVEEACGDRECDGGEEEDELGAEQDLLEVDEEAAEGGAGDLADQGHVGLLAEGGGGQVVGGAAEVADGHLLGAGAGLEQTCGGGVHAPPPLVSGDSAPAPVRKGRAKGVGFGGGARHLLRLGSLYMYTRYY